MIRIASVPYSAFSGLPGALKVKMYASPRTMPGTETGRTERRQSGPLAAVRHFSTT